MITKQQRDEWIAALRSGEFEQTIETLYDGKHYCCLGVLCRVLDVEVVPLPSYGLDAGHLLAYDKLKHLIGVDNVNSLSGFNDFDQLSFPLIAQWIEEHVEYARE